MGIRGLGVCLGALVDASGALAALRGIVGCVRVALGWHRE